MFRKSKHNPTDDDRVPSPVQQVQTPVAASEAPEPSGEISSISSEITIVGKITGKGTGSFGSILLAESIAKRV